MTGQDPGRNAAGAGALLIAAIVVCAAAGLATGAVLGVHAVLSTSVGALVGAGVGFWIVYKRFKDL